MSVLAAGAAAGFAVQVIQVAGAILVLSAFAAAQFGALSTRSSVYLALNLLGSAVLAALAAIDGQLGFLLLEGVWAGLSAWSLLRRSGRSPDRASRRRRELTWASRTCGEQRS